LPNVVSENNPKILNVKDGLDGAIEKFHQIFTTDVQSKFYGLYRVRSVPANDLLYVKNIRVANPSKDSDYLTSRRLVAESFLSGEIPSFSYEDVEKIDKEIAKKIKEITDYDVNAPNKDNDYNLMVAKKRMINQELIRLRGEEMKLVGEDEAALRSTLAQAERRVISSGKVSIEDYEYFDDSTPASLYSKFQEMVKNRLVSENKLSSDETKTWKFNGGRTITGEDKDSSLRLRARFEDARQKRETKVQEVGPTLLRVGSTLNRFSGTDKVKQIEE
jgi:hypothetical protein